MGGDLPIPPRGLFLATSEDFYMATEKARQQRMISGRFNDLLMGLVRPYRPVL